MALNSLLVCLTDFPRSQKLKTIRIIRFKGKNGLMLGSKPRTLPQLFLSLFFLKCSIYERSPMTLSGPSLKIEFEF